MICHVLYYRTVPGAICQLSSSDKSPPDSPQPSTFCVQSGSGRHSNHELGYSLLARHVYDSVKFGIKGTDVVTRHYQLVNKFTSIMNDIVDETLGNADPTQYARFVLKSSDFESLLNTSYQRRREVSGAWPSELPGKLLQITNLKILIIT